MRSSDFVREVAHGNQTREKTVSRLWFDGKHLYSYGSHYPLLIKYRDKWLVNDRGYSVTTSKHIGMANRHADYAVNLQINRQFLGEDRTSYSHMLENTKNEIEYLKGKLTELSKRAWKQRENIEANIAKYQLTVEYLEANPPE